MAVGVQRVVAVEICLVVARRTDATEADRNPLRKVADGVGAVPGAGRQALDVKAGDGSAAGLRRVTGSQEPQGDALDVRIEFLEERVRGVASCRHVRRAHARRPVDDHHDVDGRRRQRPARTRGPLQAAETTVLVVPFGTPTTLPKPERHRGVARHDDRVAGRAHCIRITWGRTECTAAIPHGSGTRVADETNIARVRTAVVVAIPHEASEADVDLGGRQGRIVLRDVVPRELTSRRPVPWQLGHAGERARVERVPETLVLVPEKPEIDHDRREAHDHDEREREQHHHLALFGAPARRPPTRRPPARRQGKPADLRTRCHGYSILI